MKDPTALQSAAATLKPATHAALSALLTHFGDASVIDELEKLNLPASGVVQKALAEARELGKTCGADEVSFDFCDVHGYQYLTGATFSVNIPAICSGGFERLAL
ncbi:MAG: ATP phosphoribosyltransferase regulatory subunit [Duodenibacillus massiliensis]